MALGSGLSKLEWFAIQIHWSFHSKFKISLLHHTHHCGIWILPFPAEFQPQLDSMKSHSEPRDTELTQARIMQRVQRGLTRSLLQNLDFQLPLNEKGSCGQRTLLRTLLKPQVSAPGDSHKLVTSSLPYNLCLAGRWCGFCCYCRGPMRQGGKGRNYTDCNVSWEWTCPLIFVHPNVVWSVM